MKVMKVAEKYKPFLIIPKEILLLGSYISNTEYRILTYLYSYSNGYSLTYSSLGRLTGIDRRTVADNINSLRDKKVLKFDGEEIKLSTQEELLELYNNTTCSETVHVQKHNTTPVQKDDSVPVQKYDTPVQKDDSDSSKIVHPSNNDYINNEYLDNDKVNNDEIDNSKNLDEGKEHDLPF